MNHPPKLRNVPFDPARWPFFYGFVILGGGTLAMLMSAPGQTVGVSVFTDHLIEALSLSRSALSAAYLVGTLGSGLMLSIAGGWYDRFGGRALAVAASATLALVLWGLTATPRLAATLGRALPGERAPVVAAFAVIAAAFFLLRFSGQGVLNLAGRAMVMEWFDRRRGLANAVMGTSIAFGFSIAPRVFEALIERGGWQSAWRSIAVVVAAYGVLAGIFLRDRPEDHGLVPDGPLAGNTGRLHAETAAGRSFTRAEAVRTIPFWVFAGSVTLGGLLITAYTFHVVSIFGDAGMTRSQAVGIFLPAAVVSVVVEIVASYASDYIKLKYLALVQLLGVMVLAVSIAFLRPGIMVFGVIAGHGVMQGMFGVLSNIAWPRFFGRQHLGAIAGLATALIVVGTALGPFLLSGLREVSGSYRAGALVVAALTLLPLAFVARAERPA